MKKDSSFNISTFNIIKIAPSLAKLISFISNKNYIYKVVDYHAIIWDWDEQYPVYVDSIDEKCHVLTSNREKHPVYNENICLSCINNNYMYDDMIFLGIANYNHISLSNIVDNKITFYSYENTEKTRLINIICSDVIYDFIDSLISYKQTNNKDDLSMDEISDLLQIFISKL